MNAKDRNEFLDASDSEDQSQGYDSGADDFTKGGRNSKRRRLDSDTSEYDAWEISHTVHEKDKETSIGEETEHEKPRGTQESTVMPGISKPLSKKNLVATAAAIKRSGVVYLSRIPPFMKPTKLRSLLEPYGVINRIFLTPEDPASHRRRVRNGGNKKRSFADGWVEFVNKADAKEACDLLNARVIGGKKGTYYHDDVWNLLYLKGFKWNHLTQQIAAENAERASRMRAEISKTTKENKEFVQNVERAKMLEGMEAKKAAKRRKDIGGSTPEAPKVQMSGERARRFKQTAVATKRLEDQSDQVKRVLTKIF